MRITPPRQGPRIGKLWDILTGNNVKAKQSIARIDVASARFIRWLDYYDRKVTWMVEGSRLGARVITIAQWAALLQTPTLVVV